MNKKILKSSMQNIFKISTTLIMSSVLAVMSGGLVVAIVINNIGKKYFENYNYIAITITAVLIIGFMFLYKYLWNKIFVKNEDFIDYANISLEQYIKEILTPILIFIVGLLWSGIAYVVGSISSLSVEIDTIISLILIALFLGVCLGIAAKIKDIVGIYAIGTIILPALYILTEKRNPIDADTIAWVNIILCHLIGIISGKMLIDKHRAIAIRYQSN